MSWRNQEKYPPRTCSPGALLRDQVDGAGVVSERALANHAPGKVLQPTIKVLSSTVANGRRTVVVTRSLKVADYEADYYTFDVTTTTLPYIAVRVASRSPPPQRGSGRFRLALRTYAPRAPHVGASYVW